jgi:6-phosphogluconolactonase
MLRWIVVPTPEDAARVAADLIVDTITSAVAARGRCGVAVSGGTGPLRLFTELGSRSLPWADVEVFQVDERIAPPGDPARNLGPQAAAIGRVAHLRAMPVADPDPVAAAARYAAWLPTRLDLVQLGVGVDGHTASLVPGDPVLGVVDRPVAVTEP